MSSSFIEDVQSSAWEILEEASRPVLTLANEAWKSISGGSGTGDGQNVSAEDHDGEHRQPQAPDARTVADHHASSSQSEHLVRQATTEDMEKLTSALRSSLPSLDLYTSVAASVMGAVGHTVARRQNNQPVNTNVTRLGEQANRLTSHFAGEVQGLNENHLQWAIDDALRHPLYQPDSRPAQPQSSIPPVTEENRTVLSSLIERNNVRPAETVRASDRNCPELTLNFTNRDWEAVRLLSSYDLNSLPSLPVLELNHDGTPVQAQNGDVSYQSGDVAIQIGQESIDAHAGSLAVTRNQRTNDLRFTNRSTGQLVMEIINGERVFRTPDGQLLKHQGNRIIVLNPDGTERGAIDNNQIRHRFANGTVIVDLESQTLEAALKKAKDNGIEFQRGEQVIVRFGNNLAILDPLLNQFIVFNHTEEGVEVHFKLDEERTLSRGADGKIRITDRAGNITELSDEQKQRLMSLFGEEFGGRIRAIIAQINAGSLAVGDNSILLGERNVTLNCHNHNQNQNGSSIGSCLTQLVSGNAGITYSSTAEQGGTPTETSVDLVRRNLIQRAGQALLTVDLGTNLDVTTNDFTIRENAVEFTDSGVRVDRENNVRLPDGTVMRNNGDVKFANGSYYSRETHSVYSNERSSASNEAASTGKHLDVLLSHALGLARSISNRAHSGSVTKSEITLLQASASMVSNLIGVFSSMGDLGAATQLNGSLSILDSSLGQARNKLDEKGELSQEKQERISGFVQSLESRMGGTRRI